MAIYDSNWRSYCMYVVSTVESNADYGCIESYAMMGVGIMQWSNDRSWQLLNMLVTDYPDMESAFPILYSQIAPNTSSWGYRTFTQSEANEISSALVTEQGIATQDKLWNQDCEQSYIPLLQNECGLTNAWTAIFALSNYHQSPQAFWQIYNGCGNTDYVTWYNTTLNNGIVGKYTNRQNTVKVLLDEWDGESGKEGFGSTEATNTIGGNQNPNYGNPDDTYSTTLTDVTIKSVEQYQKQLVLHLDLGGTSSRLLFYKSSNNLWYPQKTTETVSTDTSTTPADPTSPSISTTANADLQWMCDKMQELEGTLQYSQAQSLRTNINGGYCDCSGLVWWLYNQRGYNLGTWTGTQQHDGELIEEGGCGGSPNESIMQMGDICLFDWLDSGYTSSGHIEMYIGSGQIMGHGGDPYYGPVRKSVDSYFQYANHWMIRRIISQE